MFGNLAKTFATLTDPLNLRNSSNPLISTLADPLGLLHKEDEEDEDEWMEEYERDQARWDAQAPQRLAAGALPTSGAGGHHMLRQDNPQMMLAGKLRGLF